MQVQRNDSKVDFSKKKFLIVDDFISFRSLLKKMLQGIRVSDVDEAANGNNAIRKMSIKKYDIILCDYNLGDGKDGQQVLEEAKLRGIIGYSTIFMMITAENTSEMLMGALEYEPDDYLMKPFNKFMLEKKLESLYRKTENLRDIEKAMAQGNYDEAIRVCSHLINCNPRNLRALLKLKGDMLLKKEDYERAAAFYLEVRVIGEFPWALLGLGKVKFHQGDYRGAKDIFQDIINKNDKITGAYDWLARTLEKIGEFREAQDVLMKAVAVSPKAILRQKELGNIAYRNQDYTTAERSLRSAVNQGKNSFLKSSLDYTHLAKVLIQLKNGPGSVAVLNDAAAEFSSDHAALLDINITRCQAYAFANQQQEARKSLEAAFKLAEQVVERLDRDTEIDLAKACFLAGDEKRGREIVCGMVQNSHDDDALAEKIRGAFCDIGMEKDCSDMIEKAREEVYALNNEGVRLVRENNLDQAVAYFEKAADMLKENKTINANAALAFIRHMQKGGKTDEYVKNVKVYLERVKCTDPSYKDLVKLQSMLQELISPKFTSVYKG